MMPRLFFVAWLAMAAFSSYAQVTAPATAPSQTSVPNQQQQWTGDTRPVPDPTILTTQALEKSVSTLKELIMARLEEIDKATKILAARADKVPSDVDIAVNNLKDLHGEKFASIDKQFEERDVRTEQLAAAGQLAIKDALQAAKELVASQNASNEKAIIKSEGNTTKLLENLDVKIIDLRDRLTAIENKGVGQTTERAAQQTDNTFTLGATAVAITVVLGIAGVVMKLLSAPSSVRR